MEDRLEKEDPDEPTYVSTVNRENLNKKETAKTTKESIEAGKVRSVSEINLNLEEENSKMHTSDNTEFASNSDRNNINDKIACRDSEEASKDEKFAKNGSHFQKEMNLDCATEMSECLDEVKDIVVELGARVITEDTKDYRELKSSTEIQKTVVDIGCSPGIDKEKEGSLEISKGIKYQLKSNSELQKLSDVGVNKVKEEDAEGTKRISIDIEDDQKIQDSPKVDVTADHFLEPQVTAKDHN